MLPLAAVAFVSLLAVAIIDAMLATSETRSSIDRQLQGVVSVLTSSNFPLTDNVLHQMRELSGAEFVLSDQNGTQLSTTFEEEVVVIPTNIKNEGSATATLGPQVTVAGRHYFFSSATLQNRTGDRGAEVLQILFPCDRYNAAWRSAFVPPLLVGIIAVAAVAAVAQWIAGRISGTLGELSAGVSQLTKGAYVNLDLPQRDDEVRDLALAINQTSDRLADYEQQVRQTEQARTVAMLGAGLAHEIRNAVTGCRLAIDLHAEKCHDNCEGDSLAVAKSQLKLMESRLQRFLQLGQSNNCESRERVDLGKLVEELLPLVLPAARHAGVQVAWHPPEHAIMVLANADSLGMVFVNLLLNAVEAAQKQGVASASSAQVQVSIQHSPTDQAELIVCDSGEGPALQVAEKLFQPFVSTKAEGVGLGLAVAREVALAHGGEIQWCRQNGLTKFRFRIPTIEKS